MKKKSITKKLRAELQGRKNALVDAHSVIAKQQAMILGLQSDLEECGRIAKVYSGNTLFEKSWPDTTPVQHVQRLRENYQHMMAMFGVIATDVFRGVRLTELINKLDEQYKKRKEDANPSCSSPV